MLFAGCIYVAKWAIVSWLGAGQSVPRQFRIVAYVTGLVVSLAAAFGLPPLRHRFTDGIQPEWLGAYATVAAYLLTLVTAAGALIFALAIAVPGGGTWTVVTVIATVAVGIVALVRAAKG